MVAGLCAFGGMTFPWPTRVAGSIGTPTACKRQPVDQPDTADHDIEYCDLAISDFIDIADHQRFSSMIDSLTKMMSHLALNTVLLCDGVLFRRNYRTNGLRSFSGFLTTSGLTSSASCKTSRRLATLSSLELMTVCISAFIGLDSTAQSAAMSRRVTCASAGKPLPCAQLDHSNQ